ncbi:ADP-ribosylglycohydrolase family protein [Paenibacillus sp. MBLB4367]|uniref:ADP-ribosylglycohydrolase family protein n=1 Tax=Paenibacillus sp. MBLB4367 TaxID=3384767 RepID=UPI00390818CE
MSWYRSDPKDIGTIIRQTFRNYNGNWFEASFLADMDLGLSAGNGSLMRCLPVALAYPRQADMEKAARLQSKMTHYDELASEACQIYCRIARRLLEGEELKPALELETAGTLYGPTLLGTPDCEPSGFVVDTFRWVLHCLLHAASFEEVVQKAANLGGDSDTIGAIAGGLAGVYYGYDGIPERYSGSILVKERLEKLAGELYRHRMASI